MRTALFLFLALSLAAGMKPLTLRGKAQDFYYLPGSGPPRGTVLYLPGDGGWRGFAIDMAQAMAGWGYEVYALDTRRYLMSFTNGRTLTADEMRGDMLEVARQLNARGVLFVGWSQGAAMVALASSSPDAPHLLGGLVCIGLPDHAVLGWRTIDNLTYITKKDPDEPMFQTEPALAALTGLRLAVIESKGDEYTHHSIVRRLLDRVRGPKKLTIVDARSHSFDGNHRDFFLALQEGLQWAASATP
jgi:pimeloyl-ACP methyl ester carboxylesterase